MGFVSCDLPWKGKSTKKYDAVGLESTRTGRQPGGFQASRNSIASHSAAKFMG